MLFDLWVRVPPPPDFCEVTFYFILVPRAFFLPYVDETHEKKKMFSSKKKKSRRELEKGRRAMNSHGELEFRGFGTSIFQKN